MKEKILVYGRPYCAMVPPVRKLLERAEVDYEYTDIWEDEEAAARVRRINQGNETVPTLVFPDGATMTEPSLRELLGKLAEMGYQLKPRARSRTGSG